MIVLQLGSQGPTVSDWQRTLKLAGFPVELDGDFGAETEAATRAFQRRARITADGEVGDETRAAAAHFATPANSATPHTFPELLLRVAASQVGTRETSENQGPGIEKYWRATNYPEGYADRAPWCAAFLCWVVATSMTDARLNPGLTEANRPQTAGAKDWINWAAGKATREFVTVLSPTRATPRPGDVIVYTFSHIGLCESYDSRRVPALRCVEGNTNSDGSREGVEVLIHPRPMAQVQAIIRFGTGGKA